LPSSHRRTQSRWYSHLVTPPAPRGQTRSMRSLALLRACPCSCFFVDEVDGAGFEWSRAHQAQMLRRGSLFEEWLPASQHQRMHDEVELVDERLAREGLRERRASRHEDILARLRF